jgi:hypothetical protein
MAKMTGAEMASKWGTRLVNAQGDMITGVERMTVSPTEEAAKAIPKMKAAIIRAIDSGKVERGLRAVSKEDWINKYKELVPQRLASGVEAAKEKAAAVFGKILSYQDGYLGEIRRMPTTTLEESILKMTANVRKMASFDKTK